MRLISGIPVRLPVSKWIHHDDDAGRMKKQYLKTKQLQKTKTVLSCVVSLVNDDLLAKYFN
jgi:hypothetical protein